jgi:hypothetical protein
MRFSTAFPILLFTETKHTSGFFLKEKSPCTLPQCQLVNRKRSSHTLAKPEMQSGFFFKENPLCAISETTSMLENRI